MMLNDSDLKPENILIDYVGHVALCDFGLAKTNMTESETTNSEFLTSIYHFPAPSDVVCFQLSVELPNISLRNYSSVTGIRRPLVLPGPLVFWFGMRMMGSDAGWTL